MSRAEHASHTCALPLTTSSTNEKAVAHFMRPPQPVPAHHLWPSSSARRDSVSNQRSALRIPSATTAVFGLLRSWPGAATISLFARARSRHSQEFLTLRLG